MVKAYSTPVSAVGDLSWKWQQENNELRKEIAELKSVLGYYADKGNYLLLEYQGVRRVLKIEKDKGAKAREILEVMN